MNANRSSTSKPLTSCELMSKPMSEGQDPRRACRLRRAGTQTPDIAAWQRLPTLPDTFSSIDIKMQCFSYIMALYNVPAYDRMCVTRRIRLWSASLFEPGNLFSWTMVAKYSEERAGNLAWRMCTPFCKGPPTQCQNVSISPDHKLLCHGFSCRIKQ